MQLRRVLRCRVLERHSSAVCGIVLVAALVPIVIVPQADGAWFQPCGPNSQWSGAGPGRAKSNSPASQTQANAKSRRHVETPQEIRLSTQTTELLALAHQLKSEVDKTNKDMLSVAVIRKAGEIEKYARYLRSTAVDGASMK